MILAETERLFLRTLKMSDIDALMDVWGDREVMQYCGGAGTKEREIRALTFYIKYYEEKGFSPYAVILKENNEFTGVCGFNPPGDGYDAELMYHFAKRFWGNGYATEAGKACIEYAGKTLKLHKICASIDPDNAASKHVLEKLGFRYIGMKWCEDLDRDEPHFELII